MKIQAEHRHALSAFASAYRLLNAKDKTPTYFEQSLAKAKRKAQSNAKEKRLTGLLNQSKFVEILQAYDMIYQLN